MEQITNRVSNRCRVPGKSYILATATVLGMLVSWACETKSPNPLMDPEKFADLYVDLLIAGAQDSLSQAQRDSIITARGYRVGQVDSAVSYLNEEAERWEAVMDSVVKRLERELEIAKRATGDSTKAP